MPGKPGAKENPLPRGWAGIDFAQNAARVARELIGKKLTLAGVGGIIVETEAYDQREPASHSYTGLSAANAPLFGPPGCAYVYLVYGVHWCLNLVCREKGHGAGVLIRALEPTTGVETMIRRRGVPDLRLLCSGPGKLGQALAVHPGLNGHPVNKAPLRLELMVTSADVLRGPRIGITKAADRVWRFGLRDSPFLSRPFARP